MFRRPSRPVFHRAAALLALCGALGGGCNRGEPASPSSSGTGPGSAEPSTSSMKKPIETAMKTPIMPYPWMRGGASILAGRLANVHVEPGGPGLQVTRMNVHIEESLWGPRGAELRKVVIEEPASPIARLREPTPFWGHVPLKDGTLVVIATKELDESLSNPLFVQLLDNKDDPVLLELRSIAAAESAAQDGPTRRRRYLDWLAGGSPVSRLFGAQALARDTLPEIDPEGTAATTFARVFEGEKDVFVKMNLGEWMWSGIYARSNAAGKVAIINALLRNASDPEQLLRLFCLDRLSEVEPADLEAPGLAQVPAARPFLEDRLAEETDPAARNRLKKVMEKALP